MQNWLKGCFFTVENKALKKDLAFIFWPGKWVLDVMLFTKRTARGP